MTNSNIKARGEFGEIERFFKTFLQQLRSVQDDYAAELDSIGWETILEPETLARDSTLSGRKLTLQQATDAVAKHRTWTYVLYENARQRVRGLPVSEAIRQEIASAFTREKVKALARHDQLWTFESRIIAKRQETIALLSSRRDGWAIEDGPDCICQR